MPDRLLFDKSTIKVLMFYNRLKLLKYNSQHALMGNSTFKLYCCRNALEKSITLYSGYISSSNKFISNSSISKLNNTKNCFYNSIFSINHLYEFNKKKLLKASAKLKQETELFGTLIEVYEKIFSGTKSLAYIESVMKIFLEHSLLYEQFLKTVTSYSDSYSSYADVLSYYLSLNCVYNALIGDYFNMLKQVHSYTCIATMRANTVSSHLLCSFSILDSYEIKLNSIFLEIRDIMEHLLKVKFSGFNHSCELIRIKYYVESILQDIINKSYAQPLTMFEPISIQISIIRNEVILLKLVIEMNV